MKKYIFLSFLAFLVMITSCVTVKPKIHDDEPKENFGYPGDKEIEKSFYLIGDGGYSPEGGSSEGLIAFKNFLDSVKRPENYTFFLGDNIYPDGMPPEGDPEREKAEYMLDAQLDAIEEYDGNVLAIPGNHDWYNKGIPGLDRQEEYLKEKFENNLIWSPDTGCGLDIIEVSDDIQLIVIDSQWYLEDWDRHPKINNGCGPIKTREAMLLEVETELKKSQNKTVLITLHHPVLSNGIHGGQYNFNRHIYPTQKKLPIPILGSLAMLIRTTGGVSIQDLQNERYQSLARRLETIAHRRERVIFLSGHEHSLHDIMVRTPETFFTQPIFLRAFNNHINIIAVFFIIFSQDWLLWHIKQFRVCMVHIHGRSQSRHSQKRIRVGSSIRIGHQSLCNGIFQIILNRSCFKGHFLQILDRFLSYPSHIILPV